MSVSEHANYLLNEYGRLQFDLVFLCKPDGESLRNEARNNLEEYIAELEAERRWIPVSERLPEDKKHYMTVVMNCCDGSRDIYRLRYYGNGDWFSWASESSVVTHWKEEPESPTDQPTAHSDIERQDDKSPNDTQTQTIVYGKDSD